MADYSNKIDLKSVFDHIGKELYVISRLPSHFPNYREYSDLDILCGDKDRIGSLVKDILSQYPGTTRVSSLSGRLHVDYFSSSTQLDIKFDLFDSFEIYGKVKVSKELISLIFNSREAYEGVYVPTASYEHALRFLEYWEYREQRPDKIKHLRFLRGKSDEFIGVLKKYSDLGLSTDKIKEMINAA